VVRMDWRGVERASRDATCCCRAEHFLVRRASKFERVMRCGLKLLAAGGGGNQREAGMPAPYGGRT
jgi:hypothetical protein